MGSASQSLGAAKALDPPSLLDRDDPRVHKGQTELGMSTPEIGRFEAKVGLRPSQFGRQSRSVLRCWTFPKSRPQHTLHQKYYSVIEAVPRGTISSLKFRIHHKIRGFEVDQNIPNTRYRSRTYYQEDFQRDQGVFLAKRRSGTRHPIGDSVLSVGRIGGSVSSVAIKQTRIVRILQDCHAALRLRLGELAPDL